ncbi:DUF397 domain-containing protein [Actinomadura scrupuli]|uniref:DUF397 domain-containing protein n=1 Tax=Actinomadura scrupuli TaxID=559629 RepID=UPI003D967A42
MTWRKSRRSGDSGSCVEMTSLGTSVAVRDSKTPHGAVLLFRAAAWKTFVTGAKDGRYDLS